MPSRILLVDDHRLFREGLELLLTTNPALHVVAQADDAATARVLAATVPHDLLVLDLGLPDESGFELLRGLRAAGDHAPALVLTMFSSADYVREAFGAGAQGYALKHQAPAQLLEAVHALLAGRRYVSPMIEVPRLGGSEGKGALSILSGRERAVFCAIVSGLSNAECAVQLGISVKTVETHRGHLFHKLGVHSMAELVQFAGRHHALAPDDEPLTAKRSAPSE